MKRTSLALITTALLIVLPAQSFAATKASVSKPKSAGRTVAAIPNTILGGTIPPSSAIGINGDFYIDIKNANIYGPKTKGKWPTPTSLRGIAGTDGLDGKNGSDAKNITNATTSVGPQGIQGEKGTTGSIGATGAQGPAGSSGSGTGPAGAKGDTGLSGAAGTSGTNGINGTNGSVGAQGPTGSQGPTGLTGFTGLTGNTGAAGSTGAKGDTGSAGADGTNGAPGLAGAKGDTGAAGSVGSKGDTGATGAIGPSNSYILNIPSWSLSTSTPLSFNNSAEFGNLEANAVYNFQIILDGTFVIPNSTAFYFNIEVKSTSLSSVVTSQIFISDAKGYVNSTQSRHYMFNIIGTISTGSNPARLILTATDIAGATGSAALSITGKGILNLVGQIG